MGTAHGPVRMGLTSDLPRLLAIDEGDQLR